MTTTFDVWASRRFKSTLCCKGIIDCCGGLCLPSFQDSDCIECYKEYLANESIVHSMNDTNNNAQEEDN